MPYRTDIPGQVSLFQLKAIELVASLVPPGGTVVEVGSLFGRSSWAWGASVPEAAQVFCIDPWQSNPGVRAIEARHGIAYGVEQFRAYTSDLPNVTALPGYSPRDFADWARPVDLYYEDAVHVDPVLSDNLAFWSGHLAPGGIMCGDDHRPRFPDVRAGAARHAARMGREIVLVEFFWCLLPSEAERPGADAVARRLRELGAEALAAHRAQGRVVALGPRLPLDRVAAGERAVARLRVVNDGADPLVLPPANAGEALPAVTARLTRAGSGGAVAEVRAALGQGRLDPDVPVDLDLVLPTDRLEAGPYVLHLDLAGADGLSLLGRAAPPGLTLAIEAAVGPAAPAPADAAPAATPAYVLGTPLDFALGGNAGPYKREGWVGPERRFAWTQGEASRLELPLAAAPGPAPASYRLTLALAPFVVPGRHDGQSLTIRVNGGTVHDGRLEGPATLEASVPAGLIRPGGVVAIEMLHPDCRAPADLVPGSADRKRLGMAVSRLALTAVP